MLAVMRATPRHHFVPSEYAAQAYSDKPLPIEVILHIWIFSTFEVLFKAEKDF